MPAVFTLPRVLHRHRDGFTAGSVFIGRPTEWGNPFIIGRDGDRATVVKKYEEYLRERRDLMDRLPELRGRDLVCFCSPEECHGDVLLRLANPEVK